MFHFFQFLSRDTNDFCGSTANRTDQIEHNLKLTRGLKSILCSTNSGCKDLQRKPLHRVRTGLWRSSSSGAGFISSIGRSFYSSPFFKFAMPFFKFLFSLCTGLIASTLLFSRLHAGEEERETALASVTAVDAQRHVVALADDSLEGREGGSRGGRAAGTYLSHYLNTIHLEPAGDAGTFFQPFGGMRNILALIPGSDPAVSDELVVLGAHYDHVGYGTSQNSFGPTGLIHNGADDNASGVAGLLEVAEAISKLSRRPRRPILFALWDGEEKGLLGSYHFLRLPTAATTGKKIVFSLNLDMIGRLRNDRLEIYGARTAEGLRALVSKANESHRLLLVFDWKIDNDSDHYAFITSKIPTLMFHTGLHEQYHRPSDDVHLLNHDGLHRVAKLTFDTITSVADMPSDLPTYRPAARSESHVNQRNLESPIPQLPLRLGVGWVSENVVGGMAQPVIASLEPGGPAQQAGLRTKDTVIAIDGQPMKSQNEVVAKVATAIDSLSFEILSLDGTRRTIRVTLRGTPVRWGLATRIDPCEPSTPIVVRVTSGSPADRSGLKIGDRIVRIAGEAISQQSTVSEQLKDAVSPVEIILERQGRLTALQLSEIPIEH